MSTIDLKDHEERLMAYVLLHGITKIEVDFDGGGDSGSIGHIRIDGHDNPPEIEAWKDQGREFQKGSGWVERPPVLTKMPIRDFIESLVYTYLENTHVDWYNNEGGYGSWIWTAKTGIRFKVYYREMTSELGYEEMGRKLGDFEDLNEEEAAA